MRPYRKILEYLGGIETPFVCQFTQGWKPILEYLGGIETVTFLEEACMAKRDFRIPRRD